MKTVSLEYCHIYPGKNEDKDIAEANIWCPKALQMFDDCDVQKCIMFDDLHSSKKIDDDYIQSIVDKLDVKPDCIYVESEFIREAHKMVDSIDPEERDFITSAERTWLRENVEKYRTTQEFLLYWKDKQGEMQFSCPSLAATSYLTRLGYIQVDGVNTIYGEDLKTADYVVNVLSSSYLQIEDKAQSIVEASFEDALRKISWFFY